MKVEELVERFERAGQGPTKVVRALDGKVRLAWYVDDDDDRYVELTSSAREGAGYLLVVRDRSLAEAVVLYTSSEVGVQILVGTVRTKLVEMARRGTRS